MVIDTSALVAIAFDEPEAEQFLDRIEAAATRLVSAISWVEMSIVLRTKMGDEAELRAAKAALAAGVDVIAVDRQQADIARQAFSLYGRGRHKAALNFGNCFSYALARVLDEPLLFKGDAFSHTDIEAA